jgi:polysaccharide biosynthesis/export protein
MNSQFSSRSCLALGTGFLFGGMLVATSAAAQSIGASPLPPSRLPSQFGATQAGMTQTGTIQAETTQFGSPSALPQPGMPYAGTVNALPAFTPDGYVLGPGDQVKVDFFNVPEFSGETIVLPNGTVNVPNLGAVSVQGLTLVQAANAITVRARSMLKRPVTTVNLINPRPIAISIAGEVNRPGSYNLSAVGSKSSVSLEAAIPSLTRTLQLADGITQLADLSQVQVRRQRPGAPGMMDSITVNLRQMLETGDNRQDLRLQDGDSIYIPAITTVAVKDARLLSSTSFSTKRDRPLQIVVAGQVNRPGSYTIGEYLNSAANSNIASGELAGKTTISRTPSITQAIQVAGGITQLADVRKIEVRRLTKSGESKVVSVNFWDLLSTGDIQQDLPLQDGDTIVIPTATALDQGEVTTLATSSFSPGEISVIVVGQVEKPGAVKVPPNTPMNQAILAAGGFNREARKSKATLVRLNPDGTVTKRDIKVNLAQGLNEDNPPLRNNDTIVIERSGAAGVGKFLTDLASPFSTLFSVFRLFGL